MVGLYRAEAKKGTSLRIASTKRAKVGDRGAMSTNPASIADLHSRPRQLYRRTECRPP
jgi:hypothetical protein